MNPAKMLEYCSIFAVIQMHSVYSAWDIIKSAFFYFDVKSNWPSG